MRRRIGKNAFHGKMLPGVGRQHPQVDTLNRGEEQG